jgi:hypothetical protein
MFGISEAPAIDTSVMEIAEEHRNGDDPRSALQGLTPATCGIKSSRPFGHRLLRRLSGPLASLLGPADGNVMQFLPHILISNLYYWIAANQEGASECPAR